MKQPSLNEINQQRVSAGLPCWSEERYERYLREQVEQRKTAAETPRLEQLKQISVFRELTDAELAEWKKIEEEVRASAEQIFEQSKAFQRESIGLIDGTTALNERAAIIEQQQRGKRAPTEKPQLTKTEAKARIWEAARRGSVTYDRAALASAEIEKFWDRPQAIPESRRRELVEQALGKQLLVERNPVKFEILQERGQLKGLLRVRGLLSVADTPNRNGRVYPLKIWEKQINKLQSQIAEGRVVGCLEHPEDGISRISDAVILWQSVWMEGPKTLGEGIILPTAKGRDLAALIQSGVTVDVSSRGFGSTKRGDWKGESVEIAEDDYSLTTFDIVFGGSVEGASLSAA